MAVKAPPKPVSKGGGTKLGVNPLAGLPLFPDSDSDKEGKSDTPPLVKLVLKSKNTN